MDIDKVPVIDPVVEHGELAVISHQVIQRAVRRGAAEG
jgi:hypothetical protein